MKKYVTQLMQNWPVNSAKKVKGIQKLKIFEFLLNFK